jgi:hypothetical protein
MKTLFKIFVVLVICVIVVPLLWLFIKEIVFFFGDSLYLGEGYGWFMVFVVFVIAIVYMLCNWD